MFLIVAAEHNGSGLILFRNQIATFFFFGVLLAISQIANWTPSWALCGILFIINELGLRFNPDLYDDWPHIFQVVIYHLPRVTMATIVWRVPALIDHTEGTLGKSIVSLERKIFFIFCSHSITIEFVALFALIIGTYETDSTYLIWFLAQVPLCFLVGMWLSKLLANVPCANGGKPVVS